MLGIFLMLLQVLFIGLKLTNAVLWSWAIVLIPFYIYLALVFLSLILFVYVTAKGQSRR